MVKSQLIDIVAVGNTLGESVLWNTRDQAVWWTDIQQKQLYRLPWKTRKLELYPTPERLCSFGFLAKENLILAAFESGLALYQYGRQESEWIYRLDSTVENVRFNDGRVDSQGRFWIGTMVEGESAQADAKLYRLSADVGVVEQEKNIKISNGICWSPDSKKFYFADSARQTIYTYDFDAETGSISNREVFKQAREKNFPDGAVVDSEGYLWSAQWGGSAVIRYAPDGSENFVLELPVSQPTCIAFGGEDMNLLFVTSAREGLSEEALALEPKAGHLFVFKLSVKGTPANLYG